ncbi:MAG: ATPase P [Desulfotomaculaceae bacterium]|nr:ATPase P [Desulfotomaculaceae bacterium]
MIKISIPGRGTLTFHHIVLDYNGTMGRDGNLIPGVKERLYLLAENLEVHIITADTFGLCKTSCQGIKAVIHILTSATGSTEKEQYVEALGPEGVMSIGNGSNDALMLARAAVGVAVLGPEGTSTSALQASDVVVRDINDGLDLLLNPKRLIATLRT